MKKIAAFSLLLLILICLYSYYCHDEHYPSLADFLNSPEKYTGMKMEVTGYVRNVTTDSFFIERNGLVLLVKGIAVSEGEYIGISGTLKENYLQAENYRPNYNYLLKYAVSLIGFAIFIFFFLKEWKLTLRGFESA